MHCNPVLKLYYFIHPRQLIRLAVTPFACIIHSILDDNNLPKTPALLRPALYTTLNLSEVLLTFTTLMLEIL
jgi:hypothetical protein